MMDSGERRLTLEELVSVVDEIEPYVLTLEDVNGGLDGAKEAKVLVVLKRPGGVLLAVPAGFIAGDLLEQGNGGADLMFGPSLDITVPGVVLDNGVVSPTGTTVNAVLVDCTAAVLDYLRLPSMFEEIASTFDTDDPYALPAGEAAVAAAMDWIPQVAGLAEFYTAESSALNTPVAKRRATRPGAEKDTPSVAKGGRPKKPTMASLAESMETLTLTIPGLASQLQELSDRQLLVEQRLALPQSGHRGTLSQPLGASFEGRLASLSSLAATAKAPPRTTERQQLGLLASPAFKQSEVKELAEEKQLHGDTLAHAVLEQSRALTSLIGQISQSSSDPLADLGSGGGVGTRGSAGRARLQQELAAQKGVFFDAVVQSMARRMSPTSPTETDHQVLLSRGVSGTRYLERFGGYGRQRELGYLMFQIMTVFDFMMSNNGPASRDALALLAVMVEQMVMDNGRIEVASLLVLQEDPPASIFTNRQVVATSRSRSFSPLADQRWITVALAFLREMDLIASKRLEFTGGGKASGAGSEDTPTPKPKGAPKKKGRGKGANQALDEEAA